ncbi:helix-turn-helix transcriptional regulator [Nocardia cyriacigeorgica]|uniref:Response regulator protein vraR n=1 Tax=Nocardia cyriacigeorgica TaxID=135487 RepID=A0A4U8W7B1_9NOCA|nr:LuxR C-terminal-related transcriptional regulator [Nocardia cyriacigeorgica]VFA97498.1 Response regulator protein vraR [Nocardia cyriacigeorgica]
MVADLQWWSRLAGEIRAAGRGDVAIDDPLRVMRAALGFDCLALIAGGPPGSGGAAQTAVVNLGFPAQTLDYITTMYSRKCPVHRLVLQRGLPTRFVDVPFDIRETQTYREAILPNGFHEGVTLPLPQVTEGSIPGFVAMSSTHGTPLDDQSRLAMSMLSHDLAGLLDPGAAVEDANAEVVVRIVRDQLEVRAGDPGWGPLDPSAFRLVARYAKAGSPGRLSFLRRSGDGAWWQVRAVRRTDAVLVRMYRAPAIGHLTGRELDVVGLVARGWSNEQIAEGLGIAVRTVRSHIESLLTKLDCANRTALARTAFEHELDSLDAIRLAGR